MLISLRELAFWVKMVRAFLLCIGTCSHYFIDNRSQKMAFSQFRIPVFKADENGHVLLGKFQPEKCWRRMRKNRKRKERKQVITSKIGHTETSKKVPGQQANMKKLKWIHTSPAARSFYTVGFFLLFLFRSFPPIHKRCFCLQTRMTSHQSIFRHYLAVGNYRKSPIYSGIWVTTHDNCTNS